MLLLTLKIKQKLKTMKTLWYIGGLHFECFQCGNCCSGPDEGYIWITKPEIELLAKHLRLSVEQLRKKYLKRIGTRTSIIEEGVTKDCIFLTKIDGRKGCAIYPVRPNQCRTWPFWASNLMGPDGWNGATVKCPGVNRGRLYSVEEIEQVKNSKKWWSDDRKK